MYTCTWPEVWKLICRHFLQNERLKRELHEERQGIGNFLEDLSVQKSRANRSVAILEKEVSNRYSPNAIQINLIDDGADIEMWKDRSLI